MGSLAPTVEGGQGGRIAARSPDPVTTKGSALPPLFDHPSYWRWVLAGSIVLAAVVAICLELFSAGFRRWTVDHPVTVAIGTGAALVGLTALVVERLIAVSEARRWRTPALLGLDAYVFSADRANQRIHARLVQEVKGLPAPPGGGWVFRFGQALTLILEQRRLALLEISDFVRLEADALALVAMQVGGTASRAEGLNDSLERIFVEQARLARIAEIPAQLSYYGGGFNGPGAARLRSLAAEAANEADELAEAFQHELETLRLQLQVFGEPDSKLDVELA